MVPGSVPPFGHPILPFDLYVDEAILANQKIAFNAGLLTESFVMAMEDYLRIANGRLVAVSCQPIKGRSAVRQRNGSR
ncbi:MAG: hypothetical protein R3C28_22970 [Pirellulaceae bacterium]